jgi:hypothetical protein
MPQKIQLDLLKIRTYLQNNSIPSTAKQFGCSISTINRAISKYKIKHPKYDSRPHNINHHYFKTWSHNMAYILGFITADGNIGKKKPYLNIELSDIDQDLLKFIISEIQPEQNLYYYTHYDKRNNKKYTSVKTSFFSYCIKDDLAKLGVFPNKTGKHTINFSIPKEFQHDYVRGFFDGDGCCFIHHGKYTNRPNAVFYCSSIKFLEDLKELLNLQHLNIHIPNTPNIRLDYKDSIKLRNYIYQNYPCVCLERKRKKFYYNEYT